MIVWKVNRGTAAIIVSNFEQSCEFVGNVSRYDEDKKWLINFVYLCISALKLSFLMQLDEYFFFSIIVERSLELELVLFIFSLKLLMQFVISSSRNFLYRNFFPFQLLFFFSIRYYCNQVKRRRHSTWFFNSNRWIPLFILLRNET